VRAFHFSVMSTGRVHPIRIGQKPYYTSPHRLIDQEFAMKRLLAVLAALLTVLALAGCNTIQGAGRDIQKAGEKIEDAAKG
jgi:predicted small secreted protein